MRLSKAEKSFSRKIKNRLDEKQNAMMKLPAVFGDGVGNVTVTGLQNYNYCTVGDKVHVVYNDRVPAQSGIKIWVGYDSVDQVDDKPRKFQVLSTRSEDPSGGTSMQLGYAPAKRYEWLADGGGQDPLNVHIRAFTPLKLGVSNAGGMNVDLYGGYIWTGSAWLAVARQNVDMTSHVPAGSGDAALVLITIDNAGDVITTKGSEVAIADLVLSDLPSIPADTVFVCGAVRVYYGQTAVREGRLNTDFVDLRFSWSQAGGGSGDMPIQRNLTDDLTLSNGECFIASGYINTNGHDIIMPVGGDCEINIL